MLALLIMLVSFVIPTVFFVVGLEHEFEIREAMMFEALERRSECTE